MAATTDVRPTPEATSRTWAPLKISWWCNMKSARKRAPRQTCSPTSSMVVALWCSEIDKKGVKEGNFFLYSPYHVLAMKHIWIKRWFLCLWAYQWELHPPGGASLFSWRPRDHRLSPPAGLCWVVGLSFAGKEDTQSQILRVQLWKVLQYIVNISCFTYLFNLYIIKKCFQ